MKIWVWPAGVLIEVEAKDDPNWRVGAMVSYDLDGVRMRALGGEYALDHDAAAARLAALRAPLVAAGLRQMARREAV